MGTGRKSTKADAPENPEELPTSVYVVTREGRTKIGIARSVDRRARQLSNVAGAEVTLLASRQFGTQLSAAEVERSLHKLFRKSRLIGEWFSGAPSRIVAALERIPDPGVHIADWRPGMPPEVAAAGIIERWDWCDANGVAYEYRGGIVHLPQHSASSEFGFRV